jgi:hypothetical protein
VNRRIWIAGGLVLVAVVVTVLFLLRTRGQEHPATVAEAVNEVDAHPRPKDDWQPAVVDMAIYGGGQVRTGAASSARIELLEGLVRLSADSIFTVKRSATRQGKLVTTLFLQEGRLWAHLAPDQPHEFTVETGNAIAAVRDTRFSVRVADGETLLSVAEGEAVLTAQEQSVTVAALQQATAKPGRPPAPPEPMSDEERALWATEGEMPELAPPVVFVDSGQRLGDSLSLAVALGDVDGDGDIDAFVGNSRGDDQADKVWMNDGSGQFSDSGQRLGGSLTEAVALGDLDGDGDPDAFVGTGGPGWTNEVWLNDGAGTFSDSGQGLGDSISLAVALGDLDGDGDLDAFVGNDENDFGGQPKKVWLNDGTGAFSDSGQSLGASATFAVALEDLDGDGDLDAFVANGDDVCVADEVWLNDGMGTFSDTGQRLGGLCSHAMALGDVDGDGDVDAFVGAAAGVEASKVWLNDGAGNFSDSGQDLGGSHVAVVALGDLDGDGDLDAYLGTYSDANEVWLNDGAGNFSASDQSMGDSDSRGLALGDLDGDGYLDAFVGEFGWPDGQPNKVWLNGR